MRSHGLTLPFLTGEFFTKSNMTVAPYPPYFSLSPRLKIKLNGSRFDTTEVMEAESVNTLTEQDFQDAFKNGRIAGNGAYTRKRGLLPGLWWAVDPKLVFNQLAPQVPEIMDVAS
jgi:hypothetical protein